MPLSFKKIARELENRGYVNPNSERFWPDSIKNMLF